MMSDEMLNLNLLTIYKKYRDEFKRQATKVISMQTKEELEQYIVILDSFKSDLTKHANHISYDKPALKHEIKTALESEVSAESYLPIAQSVVATLEEMVAPYVEVETNIDTSYLNI